MKYYTAKGICWGNNWGGGRSGYATEFYSDDTLSNLKKRIMKDISTGAIDSGMGFEKVTGAVMVLTTVNVKVIKGKNYTNKKKRVVKFGTLARGELALSKREIGY